MLYIPYNYKNLYKSRSSSITFNINQKYSTHYLENNELNFEYLNPEKESLPLSPIFAAELKKEAPPLPKYLSWEEVNHIYNR